MQGLEITINVIKREREEKNYKIGHFWVARFSDVRGRLQSLGRLRIMIISELLQANCFLAKLKWKVDDTKMTFEECFHMRSWRPYWCPKTMKRQPCWCSKLILWELNSFLMQTLSFVPINLHRCWPREWKRSIPDNFSCRHETLSGYKEKRHRTGTSRSHTSNIVPKQLVN